MKRLILISVALLAAPALLHAQGSTQVTGSIGAGAQAVDNDTNSSKFTEYRDLDDQAYLPSLNLSAFNPGSRWFFDLAATDLTLDHRRLAARGGKAGSFSLAIDWTGVPHNFSNKAQTPYAFSGAGLLEVPSNIPITFRKLATSGAADAAAVVAQDGLIAAWQAGTLRATPLATQTDAARVALEYNGLDNLRFGAVYDRRVKDGLRSNFGPIGDRPPRSLNIQLTEPVDYTTQDITLSTEWVSASVQAQLSYTYSDFSNAIDTLIWENVYATPDAPGGSFQAWDRSVSTYGRRPLSPDNQFHNTALSFGANLPADSQLSATFAFGRLEQDSALLPYSYNSDRLANSTLPRGTAQAKMSTTNIMADYVISPVSRLRLRAYARFNGLDNETPESQWQYVTSDTSNLNGSVSYKNKRVNLAYGQDRTTAGVEATYRLRPWNSSLGVGFERDSVDRDYREADTDENRVTASFRARPARWANLRARYVTSVREGDYDPFVTRASYWYAPTEVSGDQDNPGYFFSNHPDMVRFDVADRQRQQADVSLSLSPQDRFSLTASLRYRNDDFDSDVRSTQPLAGTGVAEANAVTPGRQLGLLESKQLRYAVDAFYAPVERVSFNAFVSREEGTSFQRSHEFNENNKGNPGAVATAELGPWTRPGNEWTADSEDRTWTAGVGANLKLRDRVTLTGNYTLSLGEVDITYAGYGVVNWDGTPYPPNHQFAFPSKPGLINQDMHTLDLRLEFPIAGRLSAVAGYGYEKYELTDWQQAPGDLPWVETVGSEFLLRDMSRSFQWGNRLFNLGTYLAPSFDAHLVWAAFNYRF